MIQESPTKISPISEKKDKAIDVTLKEYEFVVKSIDEKTKLFFGLLPMLISVFGIIISIVKPESIASVMLLSLYSLILVCSIFILAMLLFKLVEELTKDYIYKQFLEKKLNRLLDREVLIWHSRVLKNLNFYPDSIGKFALFLILAFSTMIAILCYRTFDQPLNLFIIFTFIILVLLIVYIIYELKQFKKLKIALYKELDRH